MIVRPQLHSDGRQGWLLITQQEHARLAGDLARPWLAVRQFVDSAGLQAAIDHHDDGWSAWDLAPGVQPQTQLPQDFLHMQFDEALPLWSASIFQAAAWGSLCQYAVSAHFSALLRRSQAHDQPRTRAAAEGFLQQESHRRDNLLAEWQHLSPQHTETAAHWAVSCLQFFDRFSLWLCCGQDDRPAELPTPDEQSLRLDPQQRGKVAASPWNWTGTELPLSVTGKWLPDGVYSTTEAVLCSLEDFPELNWCFSPLPPR